MKTKAVIFDLWKTLAAIKSEQNPFRELFAVLGIDPMEYEDSKFKDILVSKISPEESARELLKGFNMKETPEMVERVSSIIVSMDNRMNEPYPDTIPTLKKLKQMGIRTAILSNAVYVPENHESGYIPEEWGLLDYIDATVFSFDIGVIKPDPIAFLAVLDKLKVKPQEAVFVDDTPINVQAARELGMTGLLLDRKNVHDYPHKISSLSEVFKFL